MKLKAGVLLPWTRAPHGYRLHPAEAAGVGEIYAWYLQEGHSWLRVSRHLHQQNMPAPNGKPWWGLASLRAVLTNPTYTGQVYANRMRYRPSPIRRSATHPLGHPHDTAEFRPKEAWIPVATVPAVVSQEQFDVAQAKLAHHPSCAKRNTQTHSYLLRVLVSCGCCLKACQARHLKGGQQYYVCTDKAKPVHAGQEHKGPARFAPAQQLDDLVWPDLCELLLHPQSITQALERAHGGHWLPQQLQARRENLRKGCQSLEQQLNRLTEAYLSSVIPLAEYQRRRHDLQQRREALTQQEQQLSAEVEPQVKLNALTASVADFCQRMQPV